MSQEIKMDTIILYHGSPNKIVTPIFGGGDDKHDYGRGFYLTENYVPKAGMAIRLS